MTNQHTATDMENREMSISKLLSAPVHTVWEAWTNAERIALWWGPSGFTNTIHSMDVQANGEWRLTMYGPDGKSYPNRSMFVEVVSFEKIVFEHYNPNYIATITFEPKGEQTLLHWSVVFETAELFETVVKVFKADEGLIQNVEKLENYLKETHEH